MAVVLNNVYEKYQMMTSLLETRSLAMKLQLPDMAADVDALLVECAVEVVVLIPASLSTVLSQ